MKSPHLFYNMAQIPALLNLHTLPLLPYFLALEFIPHGKTSRSSGKITHLFLPSELK